MVADILKALLSTAEYLALVLEVAAVEVEGAVNANEETAPPAMAREARRAVLDNFIVVYFFYVSFRGKLCESFEFYYFVE